METESEVNPVCSDPRVVLACGTAVRLSFVDMYAFCGRDLHPTPADVGFLGLVKGVNAWFTDAEGCVVDHKAGLPGGTPLLRELDHACYTVEAPDGRRLELMDHEIEVLDLRAALQAQPEVDVISVRDLDGAMHDLDPFYPCPAFWSPWTGTFDRLCC